MIPTPQTDYVCAHHPRKPEEVGAVVSRNSYQRVVKEQQLDGAVYLPVSAELFRVPHLAAGGFTRRAWGAQGWLFDAGRTEPGSPTFLSLHHGQSRIHWAAGVHASDLRLDSYSGALQLVSNRDIPGSVAVSVIERAEAFQSATRLTHILRGTLGVNLNTDALFAAYLWGVGKNLAVSWVAVSQTVEVTL